MSLLKSSDFMINGTSCTLIFPDFCPICNSTMVFPKVDNIVVVSPKEIEAAFTCVSLDCRRMFICYYDRISSNILKSSSYAPQIFVSPLHTPEIESLSKDYINIYQESSKALFYGLNNICGCGFRKALEFLMKAYAIRFNPDDKDKIEKMQLSLLIEEYMDDSKLKEIAKRTTWIGNDETHFTRFHEDKDVNDLKRLLDLTEHHLSNEIATENAINDIESKSRNN